MRNESRVLTKRKIYRFPILAGILFTLLMAGAGGWIALFDESVREEGRYGALFLFAGLPLCFTAWGIYAVLDNFGFRCNLEPRRIGLRSVFKEQWFELAEVTKVTWKPDTRVVVQTSFERMVIHFEGLSINQKRHLILYLRRNIDPDLQEGWDKFGHATGYRILSPEKPKRAELKQELAEENEKGVMRITRRIAWSITMWLTLYVTLLAGVTAVWFHCPQALVMGVVVFIWGGIWTCLTPRPGNKGGTVPVDKKYWLVRISAYTVLWFYLCVLLQLLINVPEHADEIMVFIVAQSFAPFLLFPIWARRQRLKDEAIRIEKEQQWQRIQTRFGI